MQFYSEEATSAIILLIGVMPFVLLEFSLLPTLAVLSTSLVALAYLILYRKDFTEGRNDSLIGLLPGHYLVLFAFTLLGGTRPYIFPIWSLLILSTLGYDLSRSQASERNYGKLTTMTLYCIIWCIIVFLFQRLIIKGLELGYAGAVGTRAGLVVGGVIWVGIGLYRIHRTYIERRS